MKRKAKRMDFICGEKKSGLGGKLNFLHKYIDLFVLIKKMDIHCRFKGSCVCDFLFRNCK